MNRVKILCKQLAIWNKDPVCEVTFDESRFKEDYPTLDMISGELILYFTLLGPKDTLWENKMYDGSFTFGNEFPLKPPIVRINTDIDHPNIYNDDESKGVICISILHDGIDETGYEDEHSRWTPCHNLGSIMRSIITLFHEPFCESPANVDASTLYRDDIEALKKMIQEK
jgi:ubiquitin-protein ligase